MNPHQRLPGAPPRAQWVDNTDGQFNRVVTDVSQRIYYDPALTRPAAEVALKRFGPNGFILRPSRRPFALALSRNVNGEILHALIHVHEGARVSFEGRKPIARSVDELLTLHDMPLHQSNIPPLQHRRAAAHLGTVDLDNAVNVAGVEKYANFQDVKAQLAKGEGASAKDKAEYVDATDIRAQIRAQQAKAQNLPVQKSSRKASDAPAVLVSDDVLRAQNDNSSNDNNVQNKASTATKKSEGSFIGQRSPFEKKKSLNITKRSKRQLDLKPRPLKASEWRLSLDQFMKIATRIVRGVRQLAAGDSAPQFEETDKLLDELDALQSQVSLQVDNFSQAKGGENDDDDVNDKLAADEAAEAQFQALVDTRDNKREELLAAIEKAEERNRVSLNYSLDLDAIADQLKEWRNTAAALRLQQQPQATSLKSVAEAEAVVDELTEILGHLREFMDSLPDSKIDEENDGDAPTTLHAANTRALDALQPIERLLHRVDSGAILPPAEADQAQRAFVTYLDALSSLMQIQNRHDEIDAANTVTDDLRVRAQCSTAYTLVNSLESFLALRSRFSDEARARALDFRRVWLASGAKRPSGKSFAREQARLAKQRRRLRHARRDWEDAVEDGAGKAEVEKAKAAVEKQLATWRAASRSLEKETLRLAALAATHYPELKRILGDAVDVGGFVELNGAMRAGRTLDFYDDLKSLGQPSGSNHRLLSAKLDGKSVVLKQFDLHDEKDQALFLNEVKRLKSLNHACIVAINAVFVCQNKNSALADAGAAIGYIEMPFYPGGDLQNWLLPKENESEMRITDESRRTVLRTALQGLAYVHANGITHCDIKPANIFVTKEGTAVLGDFDVSRDDATRATLVSTATKAAVSGKTYDYMAPELVSSKANSRSDIYSFGVTAFDLHFRPELDDDGLSQYKRPALTEILVSKSPITFDIPEYPNEEIDESLKLFLESLLARDPSERPSAMDALGSPYFAIPLARGNRDPALDRRECSISMELCWVDEGLTCKNDHFVSDEMLEAHILNLCSDGTGKHNGEVECPTFQCKDRFDGQQLARHVSPDAFDAFMRMRRSALERELELVHAEQVEKAVENALRVREKTIDDCVKHICEEILVLRCPRCRQAFVDFRGCFALTCSRDRAKFCAWCLVDCGADAHNHVPRCSQNPYSNDVASGHGLFGTLAQFEAAHNRRRVRLCNEYVAGLPPSVDRNELFRRCKPTFDGLGMQF